MNRPHGRCRLFHCVSYLPLPSPSRSNTIIGCSPRLKTKTLSFLSTPTPPISLNDQPGGSFAQFSIGSYEYAPLPTVAMPPPLFVAGWEACHEAKGSASPSVSRPLLR